MTLNQFVTFYTDKYIDEDGGYGYQCVDLVNQYVKDVLGLTRWSGNAIDKWTNYPKRNYTRIDNSPDFIPEKGDIMIWGKNLGEYGHISIVLTANRDSFTSFDQNFPLGSKSHKVLHSYLGVLGVLRPNKNKKKEMIHRQNIRFRDKAPVYGIYEFENMDEVNATGKGIELCDPPRLIRDAGNPTVSLAYGIPNFAMVAYLGLHPEDTIDNYDKKEIGILEGKITKANTKVSELTNIIVGVDKELSRRETIIIDLVSQLDACKKLTPIGSAQDQQIQGFISKVKEFFRNWLAK